mgnify:CR=1 FL=1
MIGDNTDTGHVFDFEGGFTPVQNELLRCANASREAEAVLDYADGRKGAARFRVARFDEGECRTVVERDGAPWYVELPSGHLAEAVGDFDGLLDRTGDSRAITISVGDEPSTAVETILLTALGDPVVVGGRDFTVVRSLPVLRAFVSERGPLSHGRVSIESSSAGSGRLSESFFGLLDVDAAVAFATGSVEDSPSVVPPELARLSFPSPGLVEAHTPSWVCRPGPDGAVLAAEEGRAARGLVNAAWRLLEDGGGGSVAALEAALADYRSAISGAQAPV